MGLVQLNQPFVNTEANGNQVGGAVSPDGLGLNRNMSTGSDCSAEVILSDQLFARWVVKDMAE